MNHFFIRQRRKAMTKAISTKIKRIVPTARSPVGWILNAVLAPITTNEKIAMKMPNIPIM